jgi:hypothetical protein
MVPKRARVGHMLIMDENRAGVWSLELSNRKISFMLSAIVSNVVHTCMMYLYIACEVLQSTIFWKSWTTQIDINICFLFPFAFD